MRRAEIERKTNETQIELSINLDGSGEYGIELELGFLKHMLELFARHGLFDLAIKADGDLSTDDHHLTEDLGIVLGQAIRKALGDKLGIRRYGSITLPMDEVLCVAAVDLSGRAAFESNYQPVRETVGDFSTEMFRHFFKSLAFGAEINLHIQFLNSGENEHHRIEAAFKAFSRALRQACEIDQRASDLLPSTKGKL